MPLRVVVQGDMPLIEALSASSDQMILSPVETNLEISARVTQADVIVVDVAGDPTHGLESIRTLQLRRPVLALVARDQVQDVIAAGAAGAIDRRAPPEAMAAAISALNEGLTVLDKSYVDLVAPHSTHVHADSLLTAREREVLALLADGLSNKEIAARLEISEHTAKFHVNSILQKMGAQKRVEAVVRAAKLGIIDL